MDRAQFSHTDFSKNTVKGKKEGIRSKEVTFPAVSGATQSFVSMQTQIDIWKKNNNDN